MKDKIMMLIIGILLGAVIASGCFYIYSNSKKCDCTNSNSSNSNSQSQMPNGQPPEKPDGDNSNGQPPAMPGESNATSTTN